MCTGLRRVVATFCLVGTVGWAQDLQGGSGYFAAGFQQIVGERFRQQIHEAGYGELRSSLWSVGGGGAGWIGHVLVGGEGYGLLGQTAAGSRGQARLNGGWGAATIGYGVPVGKRIRVLVLGAVGGGQLEVRLQQPREVSFQNVLQEPTGSATLTTGGWLVQAAVGVEAWLGRAWFVGVRVGYLQPLGWNSLALEGNPLAGAPELKLQGVSVRFVLGGGTPWSGIHPHGSRGS